MLDRLLPGETVDMPVFFYIDPDFLADRRMGKLDTMTLSYTFFKSNEIYDVDDEPVAVSVATRTPVASVSVGVAAAKT